MGIYESPEWTHSVCLQKSAVKKVARSTTSALSVRHVIQTMALWSFTILLNTNIKHIQIIKILDEIKILS